MQNNSFGTEWYKRTILFKITFIFHSGKDFERGWHDVHLRGSEKEELYVGIFQDAKVCICFTCHLMTNKEKCKKIRLQIQLQPPGKEIKEKMGKGIF